MKRPQAPVSFANSPGGPVICKTMETSYNFSAGPAMLPIPVMQQIQEDLPDFHECGYSIMEMSHRSKVYEKVIAEAEDDLRDLLRLPENYKVLFMQGGATMQFSMVPMNLLGKTSADYIDTGVWSIKAIKEARKFGQVRVVGSSEENEYRSLPEVTGLDSNARYLHITTNNTIYGTCWHELPESGQVPLVADASSNFLSEEIDIEQFGLIYAGAQKNVGPAGLTIVIIRDDLIGKSNDPLPVLLDYKTYAENRSMYNTPPTFPIYVAGLVFKWLKKQGGLSAMGRKNLEKAAMLYALIDRSEFYRGYAHPSARSHMNVTFNLPSVDLEKEFVAEADMAGLKNLKGHRLLGGIRASIYNAMPIDGVAALVHFMEDFEKRYG